MLGLQCPLGRVIRNPTEASAPWWRLANGRCEICGSGPLHGPAPGANTNCRCAMWRHGRRLCRRCAVAFDLFTRGYTRLETDIDADEYAKWRELVDRGREIEKVLLT